MSLDLDEFIEGLALALSQQVQIGQGSRERRETRTSREKFQTRSLNIQEQQGKDATKGRADALLQRKDEALEASKARQSLDLQRDERTELERLRLVKQDIKNKEDSQFKEKIRADSLFLRERQENRTQRLDGAQRLQDAKISELRDRTLALETKKHASAVEQFKAGMKSKELDFTRGALERMHQSFVAVYHAALESDEKREAVEHATRMTFAKSALDMQGRSLLTFLDSRLANTGVLTPKDEAFIKSIATDYQELSQRAYTGVLAGKAEFAAAMGEAMIEMEAEGEDARLAEVDTLDGAKAKLDVFRRRLPELMRMRAPKTPKKSLAPTGVVDIEPTEEEARRTPESLFEEDKNRPPRTLLGPLGGR